MPNPKMPPANEGDGDAFSLKLPDEDVIVEQRVPLGSDSDVRLVLDGNPFQVASQSPVPWRTIEWRGWTDGFVRLLDQTRLPTQIDYRACQRDSDIWEAIRALRIRGAPAIGIAAAMGVVLGMRNFALGVTAPPEPSLTNAIVEGEFREWMKWESGQSFGNQLREVCDFLKTSRPTAVNLAWAVDRIEKKVQPYLDKMPGHQLLDLLLEEAFAIEAEDRTMCRAIGRVGAELVQAGQGILTHCNAGGLATSEYGTALAVLFTAHEQGKALRVFADETRPLLQGARLTTWELQQAGIDVTLICDSMAAQVMKEGKIHMVIVGADRIAANGDTANKIGTYGVAVLAQAHGIPFYVAAPSSTFDLSMADGSSIPIEERDSREITEGLGKVVAPAGIRVYNPAFDVTPAALIAGIITEKGLISPVDESTIRTTLAANL